MKMFKILYCILIHRQPVFGKPISNAIFAICQFLICENRLPPTVYCCIWKLMCIGKTVIIILLLFRKKKTDEKHNFFIVKNCILTVQIVLNSVKVLFSHFVLVFLLDIVQIFVLVLDIVQIFVLVLDIVQILVLENPCTYP